MKQNSASQCGVFNSRVLVAFALCSVGVLLALLGFGLLPGASVLAQQSRESGKLATTLRNGEIAAYAIQKVTPAVFRGDVRDLPKVSLKEHPERPELTPPFNAKQLFPEAKAPHREEPNGASVSEAAEAVVIN